MRCQRELIKTVILLSLFTFTSCNLFGDDIPDFPAPASCNANDYNQYVYDVMKRFYFWYDKVDPAGNIDPQDLMSYPTPTDLLDVLRYNPPDRFSGISDSASFNQFFGEGEFVGTGLRLLTDQDTGAVMIAYAFTGSPAFQAGIYRGDEILTINDVTANGLSGEAWTAAWGENVPGVVVKLEVQHPDTSVDTYYVTKDVVSIETTQYSRVIDTGSNKIGYLHFTSFLGSLSVTALAEQFTDFQNAGVSELIVDLRYNGGGQVSTATYLGSLIGGSTTAGNTFTRLVYNDNPSGYDGETVRYDFSEAGEALSLSRVFFITTESTCSASELVINSLLPYTIEVIVIGSKTCGKPAGSNPDSACDKTFSPLTFEIRNASNQGQYYDGIDGSYSGLTAFCSTSDQLSQDLGSINEASVSEAIQYIQNGSCSPVSVKQRQQLKAIPINRTKVQNYSTPEGIY